MKDSLIYYLQFLLDYPPPIMKSSAAKQKANFIFL